MRTRRLAPLRLATILLLAPVPAAAQAADPDPGRFAGAIAAFAKWDSQNATPTDPVLFVGSSSIVGWKTADRFPGLPVVNRGFGGSQISDVNHFIEETVLRYAPKLIVFYAGNNDIHAGKAPAQVLSDYRRFVSSVVARRPATRILYISIHPSPSRWADWPAVRESNALIESYSADHPALEYVDISAPMLRADGTPDPALFVDDMLHLNDAGYDVWTPIVARAIEAVSAGP